MSGDENPGASTPTSQYFDPDASSFTPKCTPHPKSAGQPKPDHIASGSFNSTLGSTGRKMVRPPMPLYSSDTWSPTYAHPLRSAGMPPKSNWDSQLSRHASLHPDSSTSPAQQLSPSKLANQPPSPFLSVDMASLGINYTRGEDGRVSGAKISPGVSAMRFTQTQQYHNGSPQTSPTAQHNNGLVAKTDPLPQYPFGWPTHKTENSSSGGSIYSQYQMMTDTPNSLASTNGNQKATEQPSSDDQTSVVSGSFTISDHYTKSNPEQAGGKGEVWTERSHVRGLRRALKDPNIEWNEAFDGAITILTALNPEQYQMPYGTRVVNIKTEFPRNILKAIRFGKCSVMEKVAERIMKVWEARESPSEKVLFLFSVNGSKRFAGIAEMAGPWNKDDSIDGWEDNPDATGPSVGTFPLTWVYIKDVAYHQFTQIRQPNNGHPVGNMWNGMNFPTEVGRQVIELYVKSPATSSILASPKSDHDDSALMHFSQRDFDPRRGNFGMRGPRGGRGGYRGLSNNFRFSGMYQGSRHLNSDSEDDATPVAKRPKQLVNGIAAPPTGPNLGIGETYKIVVNENGQLVLLPSGGAETGNMRSFSFAEGPQAAHPDGVARDEVVRTLHGARSLGNLHSMSSSSTARLSTASSTQDLVESPGHHLQQHHVQPPMDQAQPRRMYGIIPRSGEETPTHRPAPHGRAHTDMRQSKMDVLRELPLQELSENLLKARFYTIAAEQYTLQHELQDQCQSEIGLRLLNAKMARVLAEKAEISGQLSVLGVTKMESASPTRRDSFGSSEQASTASSYNISPVRAEDGRPLQSVSMIGSSPTRNGNCFDRAPGGSGRHKSHSSKESWDPTVKKNIADLLKSPEKGPVSARLAHETSTFFSSGGDKSASFPVPNGAASTTSSTKNFSFHGPSGGVRLDR